MAELRKDAGYTQKQFAQKLHVSVNTVSSWERNLASPDDETKVLLANMFDTSLDYLMGTTSDPEPSAQKGRGLIFMPNLPPEAVKEVQSFLDELKKKYEL